MSQKVFKATENASFIKNTPGGVSSDNVRIFKATENFQVSEDYRAKTINNHNETVKKKTTPDLLAQNLGFSSMQNMLRGEKRTVNPYPHVNPSIQTTEYYTADKVYNDGYDGYSVDELKKMQKEAKRASTESGGNIFEDFKDTLEIVFNRNKGGTVWENMKESGDAIKDFLSAAKTSYEGLPGNTFIEKTLNRVSDPDYKSQAQEQYEKITEALNKREKAENEKKYTEQYGSYSERLAKLEALEEKKKELNKQHFSDALKFDRPFWEKTDALKEKEEVEKQIKTLRETLYGQPDYIDHVTKQIKWGGTQLATGFSSTGELVIGTPIKAAIEIFGGDSSAISGKAARDYLNEKAQTEAYATAAAVGDKYNISGQLISNAVTNLPNMMLAIATGGGSVAADLGSKSGMFATYFKSLAKNPMFWTSFAQTAGNDYEQAVENGSRPEVAVIYALINSSMNAAVEIGGGIETLPGELANVGTDKSALIRWITSALDEGKEELIQGVISELNSRLLYDRSKITPDTLKADGAQLAQESAMSFLGGLFLGGGQMTFSAIANAKTNSEFRTIGNLALQSEQFDSIVEYALKSPDANIRELAQSVSSGKATAEAAGRLYSFVCSDINSAIASAPDTEAATEGYKMIVEQAGAGNPIIEGIATPRYIEVTESFGADPQTTLQTVFEVTNQNQELQSSANGGIINNNDAEITGDDFNERLYNQGTVGGSVERYETADTRTKSEIIRFRQEDEVTFQRRIKEAFGGHERSLVIGKTTLAFRETSPDNSEAGKAYSLLKSADVKVVFCQGLIYRNNGKTTVESSQAVTAPDSTVYISSRNSLSGTETAYHELVHVAQNTDNAAFSEYEFVINNNINRISGEYLRIAEMINQNNFGGALDTENENSGTRIMRELSAYINQYVMTDPEYAEQTFGGMFTDWSAVVAAVEKFNKDMGADFNKSASFLPEKGSHGGFEGDTANTSAKTESAEQGETAAAEDGLSDKEADKVALNPKNPNRHHANAKTQNYMKGVGKALGATVVYEDVEAVLRAEGYVFDDNVPDGYIDGDGVIHLSYYSVNPTRIVLKHELVHYGKRYNPKGYTAYTEAIDKTKLFKEWLQKKTGSKSDSLGELKGLYREKIRKSRGKLAPKSSVKLNEEMYADFSGETVFEASSLDRLIKQIGHKKRPAVIQYVLDFLSFIKDKLTGKKGITLELKHLETAYANMFREVKNNPTEQSGGVDFAINYPNFSSEEIKDNCLKLQTMSAVKQLTGKEFPKSDIPLQKRILEFFDSIGNNVYSELFGDVALNNSSVRDDLGHGKTNNKITAFAAVPDVIKQGVVIDMQRRGNGNYDRIVVAAPIKIDKTDFAMGVMLQRDHQSQRLVLHDVVVINKEETSSKTETAPSTTEVTENNDSLYMTNILQKALSVKIDSMPNPENYSEDSKKGYDFSVPVMDREDTEAVDNYTETQYNNFGWASYNGIITAAERETLLSRYADYKHNRDKYPTTRFGEAVIHSSECPDVIMYVKGSIRNPQITKIVRIEHEESWAIPFIKEEILSNEYKQDLQPFKTIEDYFGYGVLNIAKARNYASYREYKSEIQGRNRQAGNSVSGIEQDRGRGAEQNTGTDEAGLNKSAFSMPDYDFSVPVLERAENISENLDYTVQINELNGRLQRGEISIDTFKSKLDEIYSGAVQRYGAIPEGENAKAPIAVPKKVAENKPTERFVRTIIETGKLTNDMLDDISSDILLGNFSYEVVSDDSAQRTAERYIENDTAERIWNEAIGRGIVSKNDIAIGEKLLLEAVENDDRVRILELSSELADMFTRAGQTVQAARMLKKMSGIGRLMTVKQNIRTINKDLTEKYGKNAKTVTLNPTLGKQLTETETEEDIETVYQDILQDVAAQVPATWLDKLNAWRYFAMLSNPRTHVRNLVGNTVFTVPVILKNVVSTATERIFVRDPNDRTKSIFLDKRYRDFAEKDVKSKETQALLKGTGQLDAKGQIDEMRRIFKTEWLEKLTKGNSNLLEAEDMLFKTVHYKMALAGYLQAQKVDLKNISKETLNKAREYAVNEAQKATFQDASFLAEKLNTMFRIPSTSKWSGNKGAEAVSLAGRVAVEGVLPYKRTPINIVKRGVEYSPIGLTATIISGIADVKSGKFTASEFIDGLSAGLTGTGIMLAGMLLASLGLANGGFGDDEEDKFKQLNGEQEYSLQIGGKSYSIDFLAPSCIAFFVGVELANELDKEGKITFADIPDAFWNALEPLTNLSMLSGVQGLIDAVRYEDGNKTISAMVGDAALSFAMQFVPSVFGAASRTIDSTQRTWYEDKNSKWLDSFTQGALNNVKSKIPGLSFTQAPSIDAWGREKSRGGVGERMLENFISPGYYSSIDYDRTDKELQRIHKQTGENVFPKTAAKSFEVNGKTKHLTADEWVTYAKAKGEYSYDYIHEFTEGKAYKKLTDGERAKVIANLYKLANAKAKTTVSDYDLDKQFKKVTRYEKNGGSAVTYYIHLALSD